MFDVNSCQYKDNIQIWMDGFKKSITYGRELMSKYMCGEVFVLLASKDQEINYYTLHFLRAYQIRNKVQRFIILSVNETMRSFVEEHCNVPYEFVFCNERDFVFLERFYNTLQIENLFIINSFKNSADKDCFYLEDGENITKADIVAQMILQLEQIPSEEELGSDRSLFPIKSVQLRQEGIIRLKWCEMFDMVPHISEKVEELDIIVKYALAPLMKNQKISPKYKIAFFGVTKTAQSAAIILKNYNIVAYLDNDSKKVGYMIKGIPVRLPEDFPQQDNPHLIILICIRHYREALVQLMQLGYEPNKQVFIIYSSLFGSDLSEESVKYLLDIKILEGKKIYEEIRRKYPEETIIVRPYTGTGDIYLLGGYLPYMRKRFHIEKVILIVPGISEIKVAKMFNIDALLYASEDIWKLLSFVRVVGFETLNVFSFNINFEQARVRTSEIYRKSDLHTISQKMVFEKKSKIVSFPLYQDNADSLFEKYGLEKGRTVLMSPYATGIDPCSFNDWRKLTTAFKKRGFSVCTNVSGKNEQALDGTKGIFIPYDKVLDFVNKAGTFIAIRSGLCDIVSSTTADMIIFYPNNAPQGKGFYYNFFSLERMELRKERLLEIEYDNGLTEKQIFQILEFLDERKTKNI